VLANVLTRERSLLVLLMIHLFIAIYLHHLYRPLELGNNEKSMQKHVSQNLCFVFALQMDFFLPRIDDADLSRYNSFRFSYKISNAMTLTAAMLLEYFSSSVLRCFYHALNLNNTRKEKSMP